ncbi:MAG: serine/threonine protein kinase [Planctomycetota bacterium]|jgi:serine/threonine protein kinase
MDQDDVPSRFAVDFAGATLLGIYRVDEKIADGGMGSVWLGEDTNLGRKVVVKVPHVRFLGEPGFRARFTGEIADLVRLEHPSIVRILAQGTHEEVPFFVLQYLGGGSLEERLEAAGDAPRGMDAVTPWLKTIATTLDFVHGRGVIHRDVKPANVLFDEEGHVFLSDFGIAKALDQELDVTEAGTHVGSPNYMAPEQGLGHPVEAAADQYGLATVVYEVIAGRLPFPGENPLKVLLNKMKDPPLHLAECAPDLPAASADAVMRALDPQPDRRFATCEAFADAFLERPVAAPPESSPRSHLATVTAVVVIVVLLAGYASGWFSPEPEAKPGTFGVTLLSPGAEPRRVLRLRPAPRSQERVTVRIETDESKRAGDGEPAETTLPRVALRVGLDVGDVARNGDIPFAWESEELKVDAFVVPSRFAGSARQGARGVNREFRHETPPPEDSGLQMLLGLVSEIVEQISTPLPEEAVGIGARWEVTNSRNHVEGIRVTQTMTYELEALDGNEIRLRLYVAVAALNQSFQHPAIPKSVNARLMRVHGDGEGVVVVDLDRLADRSVRMAVETRTELTWTEDAGEKTLAVVRNLRYESERK